MSTICNQSKDGTAAILAVAHTRTLLQALHWAGPWPQPQLQILLRRYSTVEPGCRLRRDHQKEQEDMEASDNGPLDTVFSRNVVMSVDACEQAEGLFLLGLGSGDADCSQRSNVDEASRGGTRR